MTLRLVHGDNVEKLEVSNLLDIASCARKFAGEIEAGEHGDITSVTVLIETATSLHRESWGEMPTGYELIGMLETAKMSVLADSEE